MDLAVKEAELASKTALEHEPVKGIGSDAAGIVAGREKILRRRVLPGVEIS